MTRKLQNMGATCGMVSAAACLIISGGSLRDILGIALQQKAETKIFSTALNSV